MSVPDPVAFGTARGRWVLTAAVLGSGIAFLDGSVVNARFPLSPVTSTPASTRCSGP